MGVQVHVRCLTGQDAARGAANSPAPQNGGGTAGKAHKFTAPKVPRRSSKAAPATATSAAGTPTGPQAVTTPAGSAAPANGAAPAPGMPSHSDPSSSDPPPSGQVPSGQTEDSGSSDEDALAEMLADAADPTQQNLDHRSAVDIAIERLQETLGATLLEDK